jgi:hypothetical protein
LFKDKPKCGLLATEYEKQRMVAALGPGVLKLLEAAENGEIPNDPELQAYVESRLKTLKMKGIKVDEYVSSESDAESELHDRLNEMERSRKLSLALYKNRSIVRSPTSKVHSSLRLSNLTSAANIESHNLELLKRRETVLALDKKIQSV